jgi:hypothetical protein
MAVLSWSPRRWRGWIAPSLAIALLAGCQLTEQAPVPAPEAHLPVPTVSPYFVAHPASTRVPRPTRPLTATVSRAPSDDSRADGTGDLTARSAGIAAGKTVTVREVPVFDDALGPGWTMVSGWGMTWASSTAYVQRGSNALAVQPLQAFGSLLVVRTPDAAVSYQRPAVVGLSFWLHAGTGIIDLDDLAVTIWGSNANAYWAEDDRSVEFPTGETFSETRLRFLGLNRSLPADTWVEIVVWLDELRYDPAYRYVTGFSIKNDPRYWESFYVDSIALLLTEGADT